MRPGTVQFDHTPLSKGGPNLGEEGLRGASYIGGVMECLAYSRRGLVADERRRIDHRLNL